MASTAEDESSVTESTTTGANTSQSSLDVSQDSAVSESTTTTVAGDEDEDDELLILRIAALESIRLKKEKREKEEEEAAAKARLAAPVKEDVSRPPPEFVIKSHPRRTNLVAIVTQEEEVARSLEPPERIATPPPFNINSPPPSPVRFRDPMPDFSKPPPNFRSRSRSLERRYSPGRRWSPPPLRRRSRSPLPYRSPPPRRYSPGRLSPRRWSPPPHGRRSPLSYRRSPPRPGYRSPPLDRRSPPPRYAPRRSPLRRDPRDPLPRTQAYRSPNRRSPPPPSTTAPESEWETDSDPPTDTEDDKNNKDAPSAKIESVNAKCDNKDKGESNDSAASTENKENLENKSEPHTETIKQEESHDTTKDSIDPAEKPKEGEASHDDVLKLDATAEMDEFSKYLNEFEDEVLVDKKKEEVKQPVKKERIVTERKIVEGKRLRKKVKPENTFSKHRTPSLSPEGGKWRRRSPGRKSPFRKEERRSLPNSWSSRNNRQSPLTKNNERNSRGRDWRKEEEEKKEQERRDREEKERKEYEEKLKNLSEPEREKLEARRRKFESKGLIQGKEPKKISLRTASDSVEKGEDQDLDSWKRDRRSQDSVESQAAQETRKRDRDQVQSPPRKKQVTDLRVQLYKKQKQKQQEHQEEPQEVYNSRRKSRTKSREPSPDLDTQLDPDLDPDLDLDLELDDLDSFSKGRIIVPPQKSEKAEDERSPSPPPRDSRRILVRKETNSTTEIKPAKISPKKSTLKASLTSRLGGKEPEPEFTEEEIWQEMMRQRRKSRKKAKKSKKVKKKRRSKTEESEESEDDDDAEEEEEQVVVAQDAGEEEEGEEDFLDSFERELAEVDIEKVRRNSGGDGGRKRRRSGAKSAEMNVRDRLGSKVHLSPDKKERKSSKKELDTSVESNEDILARMKKKNKKRMKRLQEIERDKLLHS